MSETDSSTSPLSCAVAMELLPGYAEGSLNQTARDAVIGHLDACADCRGSLAEIEHAGGVEALTPADSEPAWQPVAPRPTARRNRWQPKTAYTAIALAALAGVSTLGGIAVARLASEPTEGNEPVIAVLTDHPGPVVTLRKTSPGPDVVSLLGVGNSETRQAGFTLRRSMDLHVHAVGEGTGGQMYDYAWISNAHTFEPVWIMDYQHTDHAGGASKNRAADAVVTLPAGDYVLHYTTDDSHAAHAWNSTPPHEPNQWGVALSTVNPRDARYIRSFDPSSVGNALVRLVGARDNTHMRGEFELNRESDVRIYAMGEATGGEMHDYGWIEDAKTKRVVWQMTYPETSHAGGAPKNRVVNTVVRLPAGGYVAYYVTDGSHSFEGWNSDAPLDPTNYGITITRVGR